MAPEHARANLIEHRPGLAERFVRSPNLQRTLPLAVEHPDAAPRRADTAIRVGVHTLILLAILALLVYHLVWLPVSTVVAAY